MTTHNNDESGDTISHYGIGERTTTDVQLVLNRDSAFGNSLDLLRAELRNHRTPFANGRRTDSERPRNIGGRLKVLEGGLLEHEPDLTTVHSRMQPQSKTAVLTLVQMDNLATLADRLKDAMGTDISASDLARACGISPAAVSKWLDGRTKRLSAENYEAAAQKLGVRVFWLRTGKGPRQGEHAAEDRETNRALELLDQLTEPLTQLVAVLQKLRSLRTTTEKRIRERDA
jgi:transcriptional regulator with XRE-family HTH domain